MMLICAACVLQDVVKLLHTRLEHSESLAERLLGTHLGAFLQQPRALQLLLTALPAAANKQRLLYHSMCRLLHPGATFFTSSAPMLSLSHVWMAWGDRASRFILAYCFGVENIVGSNG